MASRRVTRLRAATHNNDENQLSANARVTRAKVAALGSQATNGPLGAKQSNITISAQPAAGKKRSVVADNIRKLDKENIEGGKKVSGGKSAPTSKNTNGITKPSTRATTKAPIKSVPLKEPKEIKRSTSGAGTIGQRKKPVSQGAKSQDASKQTKVVEKAVAATKRTTMAAVEINQASAAEVKKDEPVIKKAPIEQPVVPLFQEDDDDDDPLMVSEYAKDIFEYLKGIEQSTAPEPDYMDHQEQLLWEQRGILVDWLVEVHTKFHLLPETLYLAVNIVDRFLSVKVVMLDKLQLVGITALFIAAKYEEVFSPHIGHFRYIVDDTFTEAEILRAEKFILQALDYNLSYPNPMNFLRRISKADNYDIHVRTVAKYLMEISLLDYRHLQFLPSRVAAAAMYFARKILNRGSWDAALVYYSGYTEEELQAVYVLLVEYVARPQHQTLFNKYASKRYAKASILSREWARKNPIPVVRR